MTAPSLGGRELTIDWSKSCAAAYTTTPQLVRARQPVGAAYA